MKEISPQSDEQSEVEESESEDLQPKTRPRRTRNAKSTENAKHENESEKGSDQEGESEESEPEIEPRQTRGARKNSFVINSRAFVTRSLVREISGSKPVPDTGKKSDLKSKSADESDLKSESQLEIKPKSSTGRKRRSKKASPEPEPEQESESVSDSNEQQSEVESEEPKIQPRKTRGPRKPPGRKDSFVLNSAAFVTRSLVRAISGSNKASEESNKKSSESESVPEEEPEVDSQPESKKNQSKPKRTRKPKTPSPEKDAFGLHSGVFVTRSLIRAISGTTQDAQPKTEPENETEVNSKSDSEDSIRFRGPKSSIRKRRPKKTSPEPKSEPISENEAEPTEEFETVVPRKTRAPKRATEDKDAFGSLGSIGAFLTRSFVRAISGSTQKTHTEDKTVSEDDDVSEPEPKLKRVKSLDESNQLIEPTSPSHMLLDRLKSPSGSVKSDSFVRSIGESTRSSKKSSVKSDGSPKKSEKSSKRSERSSKKADQSKPDSELEIKLESKPDVTSQTFTGTVQ